ncbi:hypothetical protein LYNGBM3L_02740 [Moorena producens 3L]|uniref:Uncharacterized protein n=1 Tax=Moorena producens 3L TaxID=489825 RepID=F4XIN5_9CYAN|nr:hypothetical protein LYNGBM3L_02740 [Moorena producens 3L]OLT68904.1 hypothetical protein BI334_31300 [Moorena producens 3L]
MNGTGSCKQRVNPKLVHLGLTRNYYSSGFQASKVQVLGTRDQGPGTRDQGPGTRDQGPGTRDQEAVKS